MVMLFAAALCFTALHLLVSGTTLRQALVARLGERAYTVLFSLASVAALGWLIVAYGRLRVPQPTPFTAARGLADTMVLIAFVFVVLGLLARSPTAVGGERLLRAPDDAAPARGIHRITRHPFLWGVALWAAVHVLLNPGAIHLLFFGTFLVVALFGTVSIDRKRALRLGEAWQRYAALTSNVPFAAIVRGRNRLVMGELGLWKLAVAAAACAAIAALHARFFGMPVL
ncbi:MAG TPA: NnrU family protein [Candidatus Binatia bacterium]|nr:NnrU family protein [Candidatus Binatia bacterium]